MRKCNLAVTVALLLAMTSGLCAQEASQKPAESVLKHIPAGTMGYVIVNNIQNTANTVENFATSIGVMPPKPEDAPPVSMLLQMLLQETKLGEGFNPNADAGIVMLDIKQFGFNLPKMLESEMSGEEMDEQNKKAIEAGVPFVIYVPGSSIKGVFGNYEIVEADGQPTVVNLRMGKMFADQMESYIILSPNKDAIKAVKTAAKKTESELTKDQIAIIKRNNIAYHVDFKLLGPTINAVMDAIGKQAASEEPAFGAIIKTYLSIFQNIFDQLDAESGGIRIDKAGIIAESLDLAKLTSSLAKTWTAMGALKTDGASVLGSLPSLPYALAVGIAGQPGVNSGLEDINKLVDDVLKIEPLATRLTPATKAKTKKTVAGLLDQIGTVQFVGGGAPAGNGVFGLAWSIKCKDSEVFKSLLADKADLAQTFITTLIDDQDAKALKITYSKGVEKAGSVSIDSIEISHPEMLKMSQRERTEMTKALGEDKIRFLVAAPDKNTVVITFGGSTAMTAKAIAAAGGKGQIPTAVGTEAALKVMPKNPTALFFFNIGNLLDIIRTGIAATVDDPDERQMMTAMIPVLRCKTPLAIGAKLEGNTAHAVMFVSTPLIREVVPKIQQTIMMFMMGGAAQPAQQGGNDGPPPGDF